MSFLLLFIIISIIYINGMISAVSFDIKAIIASAEKKNEN